MRIQQNGEGNCTAPCIESGFNTDGTAKFETKDAGGTNWDHSLQLANVGLVTFDNGLTYYREFVLDINEANNPADRYLSLDKFQVYLGASGALDNFTESNPDCPGLSCGTEGLAGAVKIYDIDRPDAAPLTRRGMSWTAPSRSTTT